MFEENDLLYRKMVGPYYVGQLTQQGKEILSKAKLIGHTYGLGSLYRYTDGIQIIEFTEAIGDGCTIPSSWDIAINPAATKR